jgi:hypothetical protein
MGLAECVSSTNQCYSLLVIHSLHMQQQQQHQKQQQAVGDMSQSFKTVS